MNEPAVVRLFHAWDAYAKVVAVNDMLHREIGEAARGAPARLGGRPFSVANLMSEPAAEPVDATYVSYARRRLPTDRKAAFFPSRRVKARAGRRARGSPEPRRPPHGLLRMAPPLDDHARTGRTPFASVS